MVEIEGDVLQPKELIAPLKENITDGLKTGSLKISGSKLQVYTGSSYEEVTSA